jgi:hypothetical protein
MGDLGFLLSGCSPAEQAARLRELRALALVYLGPAHPATIALAAARTCRVTRQVGQK